MGTWSSLFNSKWSLHSHPKKTCCNNLCSGMLENVNSISSLKPSKIIREPCNILKCTARQGTAKQYVRIPRMKTLYTAKRICTRTHDMEQFNKMEFTSDSRNNMSYIYLWLHLAQVINNNLFRKNCKATLFHSTWIIVYLYLCINIHHSIYIR